MNHVTCDSDVNMPVFLTAKNLKSFISKELVVTSSFYPGRIPEVEALPGFTSQYIVHVRSK